MSSSKPGRPLRFESLEEKRMLSVSANSPDLHLAAPSQYTGVLATSGPGGDVNFNSSVLLPTGKHILTAAHVAPASGRVVHTGLPSSAAQVQTTSRFVHPENVAGANFPDLAIYELPFELPETIERYDIYRETSETGEVAIRVGFGRSGEDQITSLTRGIKRVGVNQFGLSFEKHLVYDFDDDQPGHDSDVLEDGPGIHDHPMYSEVISATGDSGGPAFIDGKIAGIASTGFTRLNFPANNFQGIDSRVSYAADWIDSIIDEAGEPTVTDVALTNSNSVVGGSTLAIQFSEHVLVDGSEFELAFAERTASGLAPYHARVPGSFAYNATTHIAAWSFDAELRDGNYILQLADSVTDTGGHRLDGEWENPVANASGQNRSFPSGNGTAGGTFQFSFTLQRGDYDLNGQVNQTDLDAVLLRWGQAHVTPVEQINVGSGIFGQQALDATLLQWGGGQQELIAASATLSEHDATNLAQLRYHRGITGLGHADTENLDERADAKADALVQLDAAFERFGQELALSGRIRRTAWR